MYYVGLDIGTTMVKSVIFDHAGNTAMEADREYDSSIAADSLGRVCVAWREDAGSDDDLFFRCSLDQGHSFLPKRELVSGPPDTEQKEPSLVLWNSTDAVYLDAVWEDNRNGYSEIFFSSIPIMP